MAEPRTAVMIVVEATWEDQGGTVQKVRARMENKSVSGACIRLKKPIRVGTRVKVEWRWEEFTGMTRYCRSEADGFRVGLQKETKKSVMGSEDVVAEVSVRANVPVRDEIPNAMTGETNSINERKKKEEIADYEEANEQPSNEDGMEEVKEKNIDRVTALSEGESSVAVEVTDGLYERTVRELLENLPTREDGAVKGMELQADRLPPGRRAGKERKFMQSKWLSWGKKEEAPNGNGNGKTNDAGVVKAVSEGKNGKQKLESERATERKAGMATGENGSGLKCELMAMEDIYRAAGIMTPRRGYSINKVVEMLYSDHIRGLSKEMRRASVLMALDAAGVSIEEVLRDARVRQEAIDSYEAEQRKQFEAQWAQKAEENAGIQAEMERVKASYMERIKRNQDGIAREKATFLSWVTMKQQESQNMKEAADMCAKQAVKMAMVVEAEAAEEETVAETSDVGAKMKVV